MISRTFRILSIVAYVVGLILALSIVLDVFNTLSPTIEGLSTATGSLSNADRVRIRDDGIYADISLQLSFNSPSAAKIPGPQVGIAVGNRTLSNKTLDSLYGNYTIEVGVFISNKDIVENKTMYLVLDEKTDIIKFYTKIPLISTCKIVESLIRNAFIVGVGTSYVVRDYNGTHKVLVVNLESKDSSLISIDSNLAFVLSNSRGDIVSINETKVSLLNIGDKTKVFLFIDKSKLVEEVCILTILVPSTEGASLVEFTNIVVGR